MQIPERRVWPALLWLLLAAGSAAAADTAMPPLQPFHATYAASLNGMPLGFPLELELKQEEDRSWTLALSASSAMMKYREQSRFAWNGCSTQPLRYRYEFSGLGMSRRLSLDFDHATHKASGESRKGTLSYDFPADATDELSLTFAARCQFARGAAETQFNVATTSGMRRFRYRLDGTETLKTPWGTIPDTLRIQRVRKEGDKRRDTLWVAPTLGYIMVKMEHVEKIGVRGSVMLKQLEVAGRPVTGGEPLKSAVP